MMSRDWSTAREFGRSMQGLHLLQEAQSGDLSGDDILFLMNVNEIPADAQPKKVTVSGLADASGPFVVAGSNTQIQYNDNGDFGASADLTWDDSAKELGIGGDINLDDGGTYETTVQVVTPTANRTISFPDATGTVALVAGSTGQVTYNNAGAQAGLTSANIGSTGEINISLAGAASTPPVSFTGSWFTGGTATTTKPQLLIEPTGTTSTAWSTSGTGLGVNAVSGFSGRLLDLQTNGTSQMVVQGDGKLGIGTTAPNTTIDVNGTGRFRLNGTNQLVISTEGGNPYIFSEQNGPLHFGTYSQLRATIDASGRLLVGTSTTVSVAGSSAGIQHHGNKSASSLSLTGYANNLGGPILAFGSSRSTTVGTAGTIVSSGDYLGEIRFAGDDGTDINTSGASIYAQVDGTPAANDMPGRLVFSTTADGASSPTERMRIQSDGKIRLTNGVIYASNVSRSGIYLSANSWIPTDNTGTNSDNTVSLGTASVRMSVIYAATGTINTSDANLKQDIGDLDAAELSVATAIRGLIRRYRFKDAVEAKGDNARIHVGVVAQEVEQAFVDSGLDPRRYALFCEDELEDGTKRLGIRYDELLAFVIAAL